MLLDELDKDGDGEINYRYDQAYMSDSMPYGLTFNLFLAQLSYLSFHPLEVVSRYRDPQLQVRENYSYLWKYLRLSSHFFAGNCDF